MKREKRKLAGISLVIFISLVLCFTGCKEDDPETTVTQKLWINSQEYVPTTPVTAESVKSALSLLAITDPSNASKYSALSGLVKYDIRFFKVNYKTAFQGDTITASGLICVPVTLEKKTSFPMMSYQHPTIAKKSEAPTVSPMDEANLLVASLACTGVIVLMPDYIGFGASSNFFHPYLHKASTTCSVLDFIRAGKEFIAIENPVKWNQKLFMIGYSQGGSATLAALSAIENDSNNGDISVTATACGSGIYSLPDFRDWLVRQMSPAFPGRYERPWLIAYLTESFSKYAGVSTPYTSIYKENIASIVPGSINGTSTADEINVKFPEYLGEFLSSDFLNDEKYTSDSVYTSLNAALVENSIEAWPLKSKLTLYYGQSDVWVPSTISVNMISNLQEAGSGTYLSSKSFPGLDHNTAMVPMMVAALEWFYTF